MEINEGRKKCLSCRQCDAATTSKVQKLVRAHQGKLCTNISSSWEVLQIRPRLLLRWFVNTNHSTTVSASLSGVTLGIFCVRFLLAPLTYFYPIIVKRSEHSPMSHFLPKFKSWQLMGRLLLTHQSNSSDKLHRKLAHFLELHLPYHILPPPMMPLVRGQAAFTNLLCKLELASAWAGRVMYGGCSSFFNQYCWQVARVQTWKVDISLVRIATKTN